MYRFNIQDDQAEATHQQQQFSFSQTEFMPSEQFYRCFTTAMCIIRLCNGFYCVYYVMWV